jgi:hypothetical protein
VTGHRFVRPGRVAPDRPACDACMECGQPEAGHRPAGADQRVTMAREVMAWYDRGSAGSGMWTSGSAINVIGHLATALRLLLEVVAEGEAGAGQLAEVRAVLDGFNWERDDRQYALERIERIVTGDDR